jgi:hypothetical protein
MGFHFKQTVCTPTRFLARNLKKFKTFFRRGLLSAQIVLGHELHDEAPDGMLCANQIQICEIPLSKLN